MPVPPQYFPLRWESTGDQWWYASPIDYAAANGHYDIVRELLHLDTNLLIKLTSLRRIRRLETVWDDEQQFSNVAKCRSLVAQKLLLECETKKGHNSLMRAGYSGWLMYTAASAGDVGFVRELLERDPLVVFGEGEYGVTDILYAAARSKSCEVFRVVFESAERCGEVEGEVFRWEMVNRAVHAAARGGNLEILREIIGDSKDVLVYRDAQGSTVLHSASARGQIQVVRDLLASYDIINSTDNQGNTALHMAAYRGYLPVVEILISKSPSSTSLTNNYGDTFLHMAVAGFRSPGFRRVDRQIDLMKQLVCGRIFNIEDNINIQNNDGRTALHMAVIENIHSDLVELLMTVRWINLNIRDADGMTPLDLLKQRPKSASSEILIKRLISSGGISNSQDYVTRSALVSHLKMQGIGGSPGTSFKVPDAEIVLYTAIENGFNEPEYDTCSGELSRYDSPIGSYSVNNKKLGSVNNAATRLRILLRWPRRGKKAESGKLRDNDSLESYSECGDFQYSPIPLRQRYSKFSSLPTNKRVYFVPSPSTKKRYAAGLMHGVLQVMPHLAVESSPASPFSESLLSSPISMDKRRGLELGKNSFNGEKSRMESKQASFNKRLMNQYFCFGAQGLAVDESGPHQSYKRPIVQ